MLSPLARKGRQRQRYMDQFRLVAGCIPFKFKRIVEDQNCKIENRLLVLMISSPNRDDLVFPKGGWENDETVAEAACREAFEEAGVKGILGDDPLGVWEFRSKSRQNSSSLEGGCRGYMFPMEVTEELASWPEQVIYGRKWLTVDEALKFCRYDWMREALRKLLTVLVEEWATPAREQLVEVSGKPILDCRADLQKLSPGWFEKPAGVKRLDESCSKCAVQA